MLTKVLEKLVKLRIQPYLSNINRLQGGATTNRSTCDQTFLLYAIIDHAKYLNKQVYLTFYDYSTCFDSLWLEESMISLWNIGIRNELFYLIFKLNEITDIQIKTPHGMSKSFECHRIVKQGSVLSSNICSASTGELCDINSEGYATIGTTKISNTLFVDDTTDYNSTINENANSHLQIVCFSHSKRLSLNYKKCVSMIANRKSHDTNPTLRIGCNTVQNAKLARFLGDIVNEKGNNVDLIIDREKKGKAAMINCLSLCSEVTMGLHFVTVSLLLHNSVFLASVLFNCQAWSNLTDANLKKLRTTQLRYLKRILRSPQSTSNAFVYLELGVLPIKYVINMRQMLFFHHIINLDDDDPVNKTYLSQLNLPYEKNWGNHMKSTLEFYNLDTFNVMDMSKDKWRDIIKEAVYNKAFQSLKDEIGSKSKTKHLSFNHVTPQPYLFHCSTKVGAILFRIRSKNIECKANRKTTSLDFTCRLCNAEDENQEHIVNCPALCSIDDPVLDINPVYDDNMVVNDDVLRICDRFEKFKSQLNSISSSEPSTE